MVNSTEAAQGLRDQDKPVDKTGYKPSSQTEGGQPQNPPKEEQQGEQKKQPGQQF